MTEGHTPDLIERLRHNSGWRNTDHHCVTSPGLLTEAADEITTLRDRVVALEDRLLDTQCTLSATKAEAVVDGGGTCLWIAEKLNGQMIDNAAILSRAQQGGGEK